MRISLIAIFVIIAIGVAMFGGVVLFGLRSTAFPVALPPTSPSTASRHSQ